jgi:hypothetical protein
MNNKFKKRVNNERQDCKIGTVCEVVLVGEGMKVREYG